MEKVIRKNISAVKKRILQYLDCKDIKREEFYKKVALNGANFRGNSAKSELSSDKIANILRLYPDINPDWLLTGIGEMLRDGSLPNDNETKNTNTKFLPLIPYDAKAGLPSVDNIGVAFVDCEQYAIPEFEARGADYLIRVSGSSMYPKYSNGDILACQIIQDILFFQWGKVYVIDSSQGPLVKRVFQSDIPDCIRLVSDNNQHYPPFDLPKADIRKLSIVVGVIRLE